MIPILYMLYYRIFRLRESAVWKKRKSNEPRQMGKLFANYWYAFHHTLLAFCATLMLCLRLPSCCNLLYVQLSLLFCKIWIQQTLL